MKLSRLFPEERSEARKRNLSFDLFVAFAAYLVMIPGQALLSFVFSLIASPLADVLSLFGAAFAILPIYFLGLRIGGLRASDLYLKDEKSLRHLSLGWIFGLCMLAVLMGALLLSGRYVYAGKSFSEAFYLPLLFFAFLVQGSAEELLCRGLVMSSLSAHCGGRIAALGSALLFALLHAANPSVTPIGLFNVFLFGLLFAMVTQRSRSLFAACGMHAGWNFCLSLLGVQISGNAPPHSLILLQSRMDWLSGGNFGPEGSPWLTAILSIVLFSSLFSKKYKNGTK